MKRRLTLVLIILICFIALFVLSSCDFVLDLIFGPNNPVDPGDKQPAKHVHNMAQQTYEGQTCVGQSTLTYYKCTSCGKCYLDEVGAEEITDISALNQDHLYVSKYDDNAHYRKCYFCDDEQPNYRGAHTSNRWWYSPSEHYKLCDVCGAAYNKGEHDATGSCQTCGRQADYKTICNSRYGYEQLAKLQNGDRMQKLYNKIDSAVKSAHDNANFNAVYREVGLNETGELVSDYTLNNVAASDCYVTGEEVYITFASYGHDNPLYYWMDKQCGVETPKHSDKVSAVIICVVDEYANGAKRAEQNAEIYEEVDKYLSLAANETNPYNIALSLHDAIIDNIDYAHKADGSAENAAWAHSIEGVFDNKSAVCEGYAKAFQLLLNACGVDNIYVIGSSRDVGHAWNLVKLDDGNWYWCDLTWDDQPTEPKGKTYNYFCKPDKVFKRDHQVSNVRSGINYMYDLPETATNNYKPSIVIVG